jgi:hypothetical protein
MANYVSIVRIVTTDSILHELAVLGTCHRHTCAGKCAFSGVAPIAWVHERIGLVLGGSVPIAHLRQVSANLAHGH